MWLARMSRRTTTLGVGTLLLLVLIVLLAEVRVPYVAEGPGPTVNTLGSYAGSKVIQVKGAPDPSPDGHLNLTTVSVTEGFNLLTAMRYWADSNYSVIPREIIYPPGQSQQQITAADRQQFTESQDSAETVALRLAGYPVQVIVASLAAGSPSSGKLTTGDQILSVDGTKAISGLSVQQAVGKLSPGDTATVVVQRGVLTLTEKVRLGRSPQDAKAAVLGITIDQKQPHPGLSISFDIDKIGGPSAGLMFTLGLYDMLTPGNLTGGKFIAGTGEIDDNGDVLPIGGIHQKTVAARAKGASYFLTPADNCGEALTDLPSGLRLVKVSDVDDALSALKAIRTGQGTLPACTR